MEELKKNVRKIERNEEIVKENKSGKDERKKVWNA